MYESGLTGIFAGRFGNMENYCVHYTLNISLFYFHFWMMKKFSIKRRYMLAFTLLFLGEIFLYILLLAILNHFFTDYNQATVDELFGIDYKFVASAVYRSIFFIIVSTGYWFLRQYLNERKKTEEIERDRLQLIVKKEIAEKNLLLAQNAYLRAQVNPHFLFNSLAFIYRRIRKSDKLAGEVITSLTSLMRYSIEISHDTEMVFLTEEINHVYDFVNILKILKLDDFNFETKLECDLKDVKVIPFLLLTLTENMYKHGDLSDSDNFGLLAISLEKGVLRIETKNQISHKKKFISLKTGLSNLQKRITDCYGMNAVIASIESDGVFYVSISLPI
jgi:two-component system LytT family sensor kinase